MMKLACLQIARHSGKVSSIFGAGGSMCRVGEAHKVAPSYSKLCNLVMNSLPHICDIMPLNKLLTL